MLSSRRVEGVNPRTCYTARACVIGAMLLVAGCASRHAANERPYGVAGPRAAQVQQTSQRVEIEDDGLPAQLAPRHRRPEPDDPREPWSPNYGTVSPVRNADAPPSSNPAPRAAPVTVARQATLAEPTRAPARVAPMQLSMHEDEVIRRAIAAHEMRRRD